jgi:hypothetical protein
MLIVLEEAALQKAMRSGAEPFDINDTGNQPTTLVNYWWAGSPHGAYGRHMNLIASSKDYLYCIAITDDGLFPKYIQDIRAGGINSAGAPSRGVPIPRELKWLLTPIVEYNGEKKYALEHRHSNLAIVPTLALGGSRVRIFGAHETPKSPLFELNNGLADLYRLLREGRYDAVQSRLEEIGENGGALPLLSQRPPDIVDKRIRHLADKRLEELFTAYNLLCEGKLGPDTQSGRANMELFRITERELELFRRYREFIKSWMDDLGAERPPQFAVEQLTVRFDRMAVQWAKDMRCGTTRVSRIGKNNK